MDVQSVLARIVDNPKLPTPPALTLRVLERANKPNCSISEIGKIINHDAALCSKMLRLVNSSLFGLQRPVTSIERALNLLGLNHVRSLVLSLTLPGLRFKSASSEQMKAYWLNSVTIAIVCRELAIQKSFSDSDSEMVAGLLCDMGKMLLQETFPEQAARIAASPPHVLAVQQCELEREHIGVDHAEAGAHFLSRWKLGDDLTEAIRFHHRPGEAPPMHTQRADLLHFASHIAQMRQTVDRGAGLGEIVTLARERHGMDDNALQIFLESLHAKIAGFASLIEVDLGNHESFSDLFARATANLTELAVAATLDSVRANEEKSQVEKNLKDARTALHMTEERLAQAQKMEAIGRLAGGVAHDFNNLLTVIVGNCELLFDNASIDPPARELVEVIKSTGDRAADLTRQLLAFSRKQRLVAEVVNLNDVILNMNKILSRLLGKEIEFVMQLGEDLEPVKIDQGQFGQVILNLLVNARDAMPKGGTVTIETFNMVLELDLAQSNPGMMPGRYAVLSVRDTGSGMDDATLRQIFEPFFTTKEPGKGTGLGLATVHGVVRQSGGHITVSSVVGQGTVFHIYLPVVNEPIEEPKPKSPVAEMPKGPHTILLVEDEDGIRDFAKRTLVTFGYKVLVAQNGVEALEVGRKHDGDIHLLITDRAMPVMNGPNLVKQLAPRRPNMKVIFTSGFAPGDADRQEPFLQKPFTTKGLLTLVREMLGDKSGSAATSKGGSK